ncbi:MAG: ABC transporter substrate-binding protein [candidate division WOR-3 bacterium]
MLKRIGISALGVLGLMSIGCPQKPKEVKIGVLLPLSASGELSGYARDILNGVYMGLAETGDKVQGATIKIIEKDYAGDPSKLEAILKELEAEGVVAVIGPVTSTDALAIKATVNAMSLPTLTPSATYNNVIEGSNYLWRVCASNKHIGQAAAHLAGPEGLGLEEVAIVELDGNPYSEELASNFSGFAGDAGIKITKTVIRKPGEPICDENTVKDILKSFKAPQEKTGIFLPLYYEDAARAIVALRKAGYKGAIIGGDGWDSRKLPALVGDVPGACYFVTHFSPDDPSIKPFVERYTARYSESPSSFSALGYDAYMVLYNVLSKAQSITREGLRDQMQFVAYEGSTGKIEFGKQYEPSAKATVVVKMEGAKFSFYKKFILSPYKSAAKATETPEAETPQTETPIRTGKEVKPK